MDTIINIRKPKLPSGAWGLKSSILHWYFILPAFLLLVLPACNSNSKKQRLGPKEEKAETTGVNKALLQSSLVLDTIIPNPGIKYKETRKINPQQPPVVLDFTNSDPDSKDLDLADYFTKARYIKLKYPFPEKGSFLGNTDIHVYYERGASSGSGYNSSVLFSSGNIIAGDAYMGFHCYDKDGNYQYTIASPDEFPVYDKNNNEISIQYNPATGMIRSFSILEDNCLILMVKNNAAQLHFHNISAKNTYLTRPVYKRAGRLYLLSAENYVDYTYSPLDTIYPSFMNTFDIKGDTLCRFMNYNPKPVLQNKAYANPDSQNIYYFDGILTIRQAYNDTVYRMKSPSELQAAYVLNFGKQKLDIQTALWGNKAGKLIPYDWIETKDFVFFIYTENYDCQNCREKQTVKFFYSYYDKKSRQLYRIPVMEYPEEYWLSNSIENSIPLVGENIRSHDAFLYVGYTKLQLEKILKHKNFASLPAPQQEKTKELYNDMVDGELWVMILE
jgi:hypothetical protein